MKKILLLEDNKLQAPITTNAAKVIDSTNSIKVKPLFDFLFLFMVQPL